MRYLAIMVLIGLGCETSNTVPASPDADAGMPSCSEAWSHYYGTGCAVNDPYGDPSPVSYEIYLCQLEVNQIPANTVCEHTLDELLDCLNSEITSCGQCAEYQWEIVSCTP